MQNKIPHIIITKYLLGEANADEMAALNSWREMSSENEAVFQEYREIQTIAASDKARIPDKETIWKRLTAQIERNPKEEKTERNLKTTKTYNRPLVVRIASIAAAIALVIGFSLSYFRPAKVDPSANEITVRAPGGQKSEIVLPDGTSIWLNSGSALTYNADYGTGNRTVRLEGEAFFDVTHNDKKIFEVLTGDIRVQVHGTAFGVKAYKEEESVGVSLLRGHVTVHSTSSKRLLADLKPDQKAVITKNTLTCSIEDCNAETENIWRYGKLKIEGAPISEVIDKISRWYGIDMSVQGNVGNEKYWFTIKTESLTEMLNLIDRITPIHYTINGEEVTIQYKK